MKIRALIVDDEPLARTLIERLLEDVSEIELIGLCRTGKEAIQFINELKPDIVFLDIQLKDITGFDVLERIIVPIPLIIFVTAFDKYAIKAFEIYAFDYLLKPYSEKRFYSSIYKAIDAFKQKEVDDLQQTVTDLLAYIQTIKSKTTASNSKRVPVTSRNKTIFVDLEDIIYVTASNYYIEIFTKETKHLIRESMSSFMNELDANKFARIHRSSIINMSFIDELISTGYSEIDVKMNDGKILRVSKSYRKDFLVKMGLRK